MRDFFLADPAVELLFAERRVFRGCRSFAPSFPSFAAAKSNSSILSDTLRFPELLGLFRAEGVAK
eukprot:COSAG02_NODE_16747_length_1058_cov_3.826903_2_plen_64_part_01